jgi:hypothetical protein
VDAGDAEKLVRPLQLVEELASHAEIADEVASICEWGIFRQKYSGAALPLDLMGPRSRAIVEDLQTLWAPWDPVLEVLFPFFDAVIERIHAEYPALSGQRTAHVRLGATTFRTANLFQAYASLNHDAAHQRFEDLFLDYAVNSDTVAYDIAHCAANKLGEQLSPLGLPDQASPDYLRTLLDYAHSAIRFTWQHMDEILTLLQEPCDDED